MQGCIHKGEDPMFQRGNQKRNGKRARYARPILALILVSMVVVAGVLVHVLAADGDLDPTFNMDGKVTTNFPGGSEQAHDVAIQADGKIVAVGYATHFIGDVTAGGNLDFAVARYKTNGDLDDTFGNGGLVTIDFDGGDDIANAVAIQSDGKIVVAGPTTDKSTTFGLARLNTDGSLDDGSMNDSTPGDSFGPSGGKTETFITGNDVLNDIVIQSDGKIVAAGVTGTPSPSVVAGLDGQEFALARYNTDGSLDDGSVNDSTPGDEFGDGGIVLTDFPGPSDDVAYGVALQSDGKIVVAGVTNPISTPPPVTAGGSGSDFALARYNTDGSLDSGGMGDSTPSDEFGAAGLVVTDFNGRNDAARSVAIQTDGKIVAGGYTVNAETGLDFALARYNVDGGLDDGTAGDSTPGDSFGGDGKVDTDFDATSDIGYALAIQVDGKIVLAGTSGPRFTLSEGAVLTPSGSTGDDFALARYNTNGNLDPTFSTDGLVTTDFFAGTDRALGVAIQKDGKIVAAGFADNDGQQFALARYLTTIASADLSVTVTDSPDPVFGGKNILYKVKITNNGPAKATNVTLRDRTPRSSHFVSAIPTHGSCTEEDTIVTCNLGTLTSGQMVTVNITVQSLTVGNTIYDAEARVSADQPDPDLSNNSVFESTRVIDFRKLSFSPPIVTGGCQNSTGTLLLTSPAPETGLTVRLSDNSTATAIPSTLFVPAGQTMASFPVTTQMVSTEQIVTITANIGSNGITGRVKLLPVRVSSLSFTPNPVQGGSAATGHITLSCAPEHSVVITLKSNSPTAKPVQSQITIPAGQTMGTFDVQTLHVTSPRDVLFTATANGGIEQATLHVIP
jgi:uncharacterized delta-60 repeat protein/uncharacterized repeat protein (TIGR01451 family)